ncbi:MAG: CvpA family protein [Erysipelotrichaceae bacterium]|nr:CvpA family protein [Erysipelotrichaceae bacterium]
MVIPRESFIFIDVAVLLLYIIRMFISGKRGFVLELLNMFSLIAAVIIAYMYSPVLAKSINLIPKNYDFTGVPIFNQFISSTLNHIVWFILIVLGIKLVCLILKPLGQLIAKVPLLKDVNALAGILLSLISSTLWVLVICFALSLPVFTNGQTVMNSTLLGTVKYTVTYLFKELEEPFKQSELVAKLLEDITSLTDEDKNQLQNYLGDENIEVDWSEIFKTGESE